MVDPGQMCDQHLLGEHVEIHMLVGHINKGRALGRFVSDGLVEPQSVHDRHDELVSEFARRGFNHNSPLPALSNPDDLPSVLVDRKQSLKELRRRCERCREKGQLMLNSAKEIHMSDKKDQMTLDLSGLPASDSPAKPAVPAPAKPAKSKVVVDELPEVIPVGLGDLDDLDALLDKAFNDGAVLSVERKAWNGVRSRRKSKRVAGLRKRLKDMGFEMSAGIPHPDGSGRLASAVYESKSGSLVVTYGVEENFGHAIKAA